MAVAIAGVGGARVAAQCDPQWQVGEPPASLVGIVAGTAIWDPDGAGPAASVLVAARASGGNASVATWDGTRWTQLGDLGPGSARLVVNYNGQLITAIKNGTDERLMSWNGSAWQLFTTVAGVQVMLVHNGDLYIGGGFATVDGIAANRIARWNGSSWSPLGAGTNGSVQALASFQNVLYVGGSFQQAGGVAAGNLAIWNGAAWVSTPAANGAITTMATRIGTTLTNSFLFVGGDFTSLGVAANHVVRYSPSANAWTALGAGPPGGSLDALGVRATGLNSYELAALDGFPTNLGVHRWDATTSTWVSLNGPSTDGGIALPYSLGLFGGQWLVGRFSFFEEALVRYVNGAWEPTVGTGLHGAVRALLADGAETFVGGTFPTISGTAVGCIARGHVGAWQSLGGGMTAASGVASVDALLRMPNGDVVAGGHFDTAGGQAANNIARWNGSTWSPLGSGTSGRVLALAVMANGELLAGGEFQSAGGGVVNHVARWTGAAWAPMGAGFNNTVLSLLVRSTGEIVAAGPFSDSGPFVARWLGLNWGPLGTQAQTEVVALAELPGGDLYAAGYWSGINSRVARWNGSSWLAVENGAPGLTAFHPSVLLPLPDGDVLAGGAQGTGASPSLLRLHAGVWSEFALAGQEVLAMAVAGDGTLRIGGNFDGDAGVPAARFAVRTVPCPAAASNFAAGCASSGGSNTLVATRLPWVNGIFHATGTGLPTTAVVVAVTSFTPVLPPLPLAAVFAEALPGCNLHVAPDILEALVTTTGTAQSTLTLPNIPPIVGLPFYHQMVPLEIDALGYIVAMTATNALRLTVGIL